MLENFEYTSEHGDNGEFMILYSFLREEYINLSFQLTTKGVLGAKITTRR